MNPFHTQECRLGVNTLLASAARFLLPFGLFLWSTMDLTAQTTVNKVLYLSDPAQVLDRRDPVANMDNTTAQTAVLVKNTATLVNSASYTSGPNAQPSPRTLAADYTVAAGADRLLTASVGYRVNGAVDIDSITFGSQHLVRLASQSNTSGTGVTVEFWYLANPDVTTAPVTVYYNGGDLEVTFGIANFINVNLDDPFGPVAQANFTGTSVSQAVASNPGDLVIDIVAKTGANSPNETTPQTEIFPATGSNNVNVGSSYKDDPNVGEGSTTMAWTVSGGSQEWAAIGVSINGYSNEVAYFELDPDLCGEFTIPAGQPVTVKAYAVVSSGTMPTSPVNITMQLGHVNGAATVILEDITAVWDAGEGSLTWSGTLGSPVTVPNGDKLFLLVRSDLGNTDFYLEYDSDTKPSAITLPTQSFIRVESVSVYPAPYPAGSPIVLASDGQTVYVRSTVSDPFGDYDITAQSLRSSDPSMAVSLTASTEVNATGCLKTYENAYSISGGNGTYAFEAVATEGTETPLVKDSLSTTLSVGSPSLSVTNTLTAPASGPYLVGDTLTFTVVVTNSSANTMTEVPLHMEYDQNCLQYVSASLTPSALNYDEVAWTHIGSLAAAGGSTSLTISFRVLDNCMPTNTTAQVEGARNSLAQEQPSSSMVATVVISSAPVAVADTVCYDGMAMPLVVSVLSNDNDEDGDIASVIVISAANADFSTSVNGSNEVEFTLLDPMPAEDALYTFQYRVTDAQSLRDSAFVTVRYSTTNAAPVAMDDVQTTAQGLAVTKDVLANDTDAEGLLDAASLTISLAPSNGVAAYLGDGVISYTPNAGFYGVDSLRYTISDVACPAGTAASDQATLVITVLDAVYVCADQLDTISIPTLADATSYTWTLPAGAVAVGSTDNDSIVVDWSGLTPGQTYQVCVYGSNDCGDGMQRCQDIYVDVVTVTLTPADIRCRGDLSGSIETTVSTGLSPFTYAWDTGQTAEDIAGLGEGNYNLTVTDNAGCTATASTSIAQPNTNVSITAASVTDATGGVGATNGAIDITVDNGAPLVLTENFDNGTWNAANFGVLTGTGSAASGAYTSTGSTRGPLSSVSNSLLPTPAQPLVFAATLTFTNYDIAFMGIRSDGLNDGAGGEPVNSIYLRIHNFNNGQVNLTDGITSASTNANLTEAFFAPWPVRVRVVITDDGSTVSATLTNLSTSVSHTLSLVTASSAGNRVVLSTTNHSSWDDLSVTAMQYSYAWSQPASTEDITGLVADSYSVTVTDANGCTTTGTYTVDNTAEPITIVSVVHTDVACHGDNSGTIDVAVVGGTAPISYAWSGPPGFVSVNSASLTGLAAGSYTVTVTDGTAATATATATVTEPGSALALSAAKTDITCGGLTDGSIDLTPSGGTLPYAYLWSNGAFSQDLNGLAAGTYTVTVTDGNGCTATASRTVTTPTSLLVAGVVTNTPCDPGNIGQVALTVSGGTPAYTYLWSDASTDDTLSMVAAGTYGVTITDGNGCSAVRSYIVEPVCIGTAKRLTGTPVNNGDGSYTAEYEILVRNEGRVILNNIQLTEDLATQFAVVDSFQVIGTSSSELTVNVGFDGDMDANLLAGSDVLAADDSAYLRLRVKIWPGTALGPVNNSVTASGTSTGGINVSDLSHDGADPDSGTNGSADDLTPTPVTFSESPVIGLAKALTSGPTSNGDGSYDMTFRYILRNLGDVPLRDIQLTDDLSTVFSGASAITINSISSADLAENASFNGTSDQNLLLGTDTMDLNDLDTIDLDITVTPLGAGPYNNTATASGTSPGGTAVNDISQDGTYPDPDNDGVSSDNNDPTPVNFPENPSIAIAKRQLGTPVNNNNGTYDVSFSLLVRNVGDVPLRTVQVTDDMATQFPGATLSAFSVSSTTFTVNASYDGGVTDAAVLAGTDNLAVGAQGTITISFTIAPGNDLTRENQATASALSPFNTSVSDDSHDGLDPDPENDGPTDNMTVTPVVFTEAPEISLAKSLVSNTNNNDGTYTVVYRLILSNTGDVPLSSVQVTDNLATIFSAAADFSVTGLASTGTLVVNGAFSGTGDINLLDAASSTLAYGTTDTITLTVVVAPDDNLGPYENLAVASGTSPAGSTVTDNSTNGVNPDPDRDGNPGNNSVPTPVSFTQAPRIGVAKDITSGPTDQGGGVYEITYRIRLENAGDVPLSDVQVMEDLDATFPAPTTYTVSSVAISTQPASNNLTLEPTYDGSSSKAALLDGDSPLLFGEFALIDLVVQVTANGFGGPYLNTTLGFGTSPSGSIVLDLSQDGTSVDPDLNGPANNSVPTPLVLFENPVIGIAKQVDTIVYNLASGTNDVTFDLVIGNYGDVQLCTLQVFDDVVTQFSTASPLSNFSATDGSILAVNLAWNGTASSNILLPGQCLAVGEKDTIQVSFRFTPSSADTIDNIVLSSGVGPLGGTTTDTSQVGRDPDPTAMNTPNTSNTPTPVVPLISPVATDDLYFTAYDTNVSDDVSSNDTYPVGSTFAFYDSTANGALVLNPDGTFTYDPDAGFAGLDSFRYQVCLPAPNGSVCDSALAVIVVAPNAVGETYYTGFETPVTGDVSDNDVYPTGSSFDNITDPANGSVVFAVNGTFNYTPVAGFSGVDSFRYMVCLPAPNTTVCDTATAVIVVGPQAVDNIYFTAYDTNVSDDVSSNDTYQTGSAFVFYDSTANGALTLNPDGTFTYDPDTGFAGLDSFRYRVCLPAPNGTVCDSALAVVVVAPDAVDDSYYTGYDTPVTGDVSDNDVYPTGSSFDNITDPANGSVVFAVNGTFNYTPVAGFSGLDSFRYVVCLPAPNTTVCDTATAYIVVGVLAVDDMYGTPNDTDISNDVSTNDIYPAGSTFSVITGGDPSDGTLTAFNTDGTFTYNPDAGFEGLDTFTYQVCMPAPNATVCDTAIAVVIVGPFAVNDTVVTAYQTPKTSTVASNDNYPPGSGFDNLTSPANGDVVLSSNGSYIYTPDAGFTGIDSFRYTVCLPYPNNSYCDTATVYIVVGPLAVDNTYFTAYDTNVSDDVSTNDTYPAGAVFAQTDGPSNGTVTFLSNGTFTYDPDAGFTGSMTFPYAVCLAAPYGSVCDSALVTILVGPDAVDDSYATLFGTTISNTIASNDSYPAGSSFAIVDDVDNGTNILYANGAFSYTPASGFTGSDTFRYVICLPSPNNTICDTATAVILVGPNAVNDVYLLSAGFQDCSTTTYSGTPVNIIDNNTVSATLTLSDEGTIQDLNVVSIDITHTWVGDLVISLESPAGTTVTLADSPCGSQDDMLISYDDEAGSGSFPCPPTDGLSYWPTQLLNSFDGEDPNGVWTLYIEDIYWGDQGTLNGWGIQLCYNIPDTLVADVSPNDGFNAGLTFDTIPGTGPSYGTLIAFNPTTGVFSYVPDTEFPGLDQFQYELCLPAPNGTICDTALVTIGGPSATNDYYTTSPGVAVSGDVSQNDGIVSGATFMVTDGVANGNLVLSSDGEFLYVPDPGFNGSDTFTYVLCLPAPNNSICDTAIAVISMGPVAVDDLYLTAYNTAVSGNVSTNDEYPAGSSFFKIADPSNGSMPQGSFNSDGSFTYTPNSGFTGVDTFRYRVCLPAPNGTSCDTALVLIVVGPDAVNDSYTTPYQTPLAADARTNDTVPSDGSFVLIADPANGEVALVPDGNFIYTPDVGYTGQDTFRYAVRMPSPYESLADTAMVVITVQNGCGITCAADASLNTDLNNCSAAFTLTAPTIDNTCIAGTLVYSVTNPDGSVDGPFSTSALTYTFQTGVSQVLWSVTDTLGNLSSCQQEIVVTDNQTPNFTCPSNAAIGTNTPGIGQTGDCYGTHTWNHPLPTDNCAVTTYTYQINGADGNNAGPFDLMVLVQGATSGFINASYDFPVGTSTVLYYMSDDAGNQNGCTFTVTVTDNEQVQFVNCPADTITVALFPGTCEGGATWTVPVAEDNCLVQAVVQISGPEMDSLLPVGFHEVVYVAYDNHIYTDTCRITIEVVDTEGPVIVCPGNLAVETDPGACTWTAPAGSLTPVLAASNCDSSVAFTISGATTASGSDDASGTTFNTGTSTVTYTITETGSGETWTCSFTVTVSDGTAPTITCPPNRDAGTDAGTCEAVVALPLPTTSDNCAGAVTLTYTVNNPDNSTDGPFSSAMNAFNYQLGISQVVWTATDAAGNSSSCSHTVSVVDNEKPLMTCPAPVTIGTNNAGLGDTGDCYGTYAWNHPLPTDNCEIITYVYEIEDAEGVHAGPFDLMPLTQGATAGFISASYNFPVGENTLLYYVTDAAGNTEGCNLTITVYDNEQVDFVNCPVDTFTVALFTNECEGGAIWSIPIAEDNCQVQAVVQISGPTPGTPLSVGVHEIVYVAYDNSIYTDTCRMYIEVVDTEAPVIVCPGNVVVSETDPGTCTWTAPAGSLTPLLTASNCDSVVTYTITGATTASGNNDASGETFNLG
ncbi:MAG: protein alpha-antigen precursor, partial [Bacteroidota bacterium]